jgi:hypothetical protein
MGEVFFGGRSPLARARMARPWLLAAAVATLASCGGGGGGDNQLLTSASSSADTDMSCPAADMQCSGGTILRVENGIGLTTFGVQTYATSMNDLLPDNPTPGSAMGLLPASGGLADVRVTRTTNGDTTAVALLLSKLGISWDGKTDRPLIIETFEQRQGRVQLDSKGLVTLGTLPPPSDLNFYDYGKKGALGTQANYANNIYFPRTDCAVSGDCATVETDGLHTNEGDWRRGGLVPDNLWVTRLHEDGATQAGLGQDANGNLILLPTADRVGVPYPGFKGYRDYRQWSYAHVNLSSWITQDTVMISEWSRGAGYEHNKMRRGFVAFGAVTRPALIPTTGTVRYAGTLRGWFSYKKSEDSYPITGQAEAVVDFAKRTITLSLSGTRIDEGTLDAIPVSLTSTIPLNSSNYATSAAANDTLAGGISARFFGGVKTDSSGKGPAELGGVFQLQAQGDGPSSIGGFLLKRL